MLPRHPLPRDADGRPVWPRPHPPLVIPPPPSLDDCFASLDADARAQGSHRLTREEWVAFEATLPEEVTPEACPCVRPRCWSRARVLAALQAVFSTGAQAPTGSCIVPIVESEAAGWRPGYVLLWAEEDAVFLEEGTSRPSRLLEGLLDHMSWCFHQHDDQLFFLSDGLDDGPDLVRVSAGDAHRWV